MFDPGNKLDAFVEKIPYLSNNLKWATLGFVAGLFTTWLL